MLMKKRKRSSNHEQITIDDIKLRIGDKLYKDDILFAEVTDESESLYFLSKPDKHDCMPSPYHKDTLIENILMGLYTVDKLNYE